MLVVEIFFQMTCHLVAGMTSVYPTCPSSEFVFERCKLLSPAGFLKLSLGDLWAPVFRGCFGHFTLSGYSCIYRSFPQQSGGCDRVAIPKIWGSSWLSQHVWSSCLSVSVRKLELKSPSLKRSDAGLKSFVSFGMTRPIRFCFWFYAFLTSWHAQLLTINTLQNDALPKNFLFLNLLFNSDNK